MESASLGKRILSIVYDILILFFIIIISTFIIQQIIIQLELITLEQIQISAEETITVIPADSFVTLALKNLWVVISFFYFGHYWSKRGQTLGMKVWKIKAVTNDGSLMTWDTDHWYFVTEVYYNPVQYVYIITTATEVTYDITTLNINILAISYVES